MSQGQKVGYIRVSSEGQNTARQYEVLTGLDRIFEDKVSGKSMDRSQLQAMLAYVRTGDEVVCSSMDRLARSLSDLLHIVSDLTGRGVMVTFKKENLSFTGENDSPMSMLLLGMLGSVAAFERAIIKDRQAQGIAIAKAKGTVYTGRKPSLTPAQASQLRERAKNGEKKTLLAREYGISRETLYAYLRAGSAVA